MKSPSAATSDRIGKAYNSGFWSKWPEVFDDLCAKIEDRRHVVTEEKVNNIFRAVLAIDHLRGSLKPGARILDAACGIGYNAVYLARLGFSVAAFDASDVGIERSKALAQRLGLDPGIFTQADHAYLEGVPSQSVDAVIAMGFFRYLDGPTREYCYRHISRVLKPRGQFLLTNQNALFEAFALNDESLEFWAHVIDGFSPAGKLLKAGEALEGLREKVKVPSRKYSAESISRVYETNAQNPLTYHQLVKPYGFTVEKILYPDPHLLPPMLEAEVDKAELMKLKAEACVQKAEDWRGMLMCYEFMAFLRKQ